MHGREKERSSRVRSSRPSHARLSSFLPSRTSAMQANDKVNETSFFGYDVQQNKKKIEFVSP